MNEDKIRGIIREKLERGSLPRRQSDRTWGGRGSGRACAACDQEIAPTVSEIEDRGEDGEALVFHARCHTLLNQERDERAA